MVRCLPLIPLAALSIAVASAPVVRQVTYQGEIAPLNIAPTLEHGYLLTWDRNLDGSLAMNRISLYRPDGSHAYSATVEVPNRKGLNLRNGAIDVDGRVGVVFRDHGFAVLDPSGHVVRVVATPSFAAKQICFAPDHSIWIAGNTFGAGIEDDGMFRRYSPDGVELGRSIPQSTFDPPLAPIGSVGGKALRASDNGIVAVLSPAVAGGPMSAEFVELDFNGHLVGRPGKHRYFFPWALTPAGTIYAREGGKLMMYPRSSGTWMPASDGGHQGLSGAEDGALIFRQPNSNTYDWVAIP